MGPLRTCTTVSLTFSMSEGSSSFLIWPSVQSLHSMRKTSPGLTVTAVGMSGCHRLCPTISCFPMGLVRSTLNNVFGILSASLEFTWLWLLRGNSDRQQAVHGEHIHLGPPALLDDATAVEHQQPVGHVEGEAQHLLGYDDGEPLLVADEFQ